MLSRSEMLNGFDMLAIPSNRPTVRASSSKDNRHFRVNRVGTFSFGFQRSTRFLILLNVQLNWSATAREASFLFKPLRRSSRYAWRISSRSLVFSACFLGLLGMHIGSQEAKKLTKFHFLNLALLREKGQKGLFFRSSLRVEILVLGRARSMMMMQVKFYQVTKIGAVIG